ncbi:MAG: tetratricopeptide repeat protein [Thermoanaerobaculia bacterium]
MQTKKLPCVALTFSFFLATIFLATAGFGSASKESDRWMRKGLEALYAKHQLAEAAEDFRQVLADNPSHYGATFQLAYALELSGKREEANPLWQKVFEMASAIHDSETARLAMAHIPSAAATSEAALMRAGLEALYTRGRSAEAAGIFRRVLSSNPNHYGANFQTAVALELAGQKGEARPYWEKTLTLAERYRDAGTAKTAREHLGR